MNPRLQGYATALGVFLLDRLTKLIVEARISAWETLTVIPGFFNLINTENRGAAFSLFATADEGFRAIMLIGLSGCALILVATLLWQHPNGRLGGARSLRYGLALILGGALGNMYDRIFHGAVTDFLDFYTGSYHWPAFNVADSAITIGAALILLDMYLSRKTAQKAV